MAAAAQVHARLSQAVDQIVAVTEEVDAFELLETIKFTSSLVDPETFHESDQGNTMLVFAETYRVLRPGGRLGISDVVAVDHLTPAERAERGS